MSLESVTANRLGGGVDPRVAKALAELQGLTFTLAAGVSQNSVIAVTGIEPEDTIVKVLNLTDLTELDVQNFQIVDRRASGTVAVGTDIEDGDQLEVNGKIYTFTDVEETISYNAPPYVVPFSYNPSGSDEEAVADRLAIALMSGDSNLYCTSFGGTVTIKWRTAGTAGNGKTMSDYDSNGHLTLSGAALAGGTATNGVEVLDGSTAAKKVLLVWYNKQ